MKEGFALFKSDLLQICAFHHTFPLFMQKNKQKKNMKKYLLKRFCFKTHKRAFMWVKYFFFTFFSSALALKTLYTQILFWSVFFRMH